eukprot:195514-Chlamydomonas_euryale.AAC.1
MVASGKSKPTDVWCVCVWGVCVSGEWGSGFWHRFGRCILLHLVPWSAAVAGGGLDPPLSLNECCSNALALTHMPWSAGTCRPPHARRMLGQQPVRGLFPLLPTLRTACTASSL